MGSSQGRKSRVRQVGEIAAFGVLPLVLPVAVAHTIITGHFTHHALYDFRVMWVAGRDVVHGHSPYPFVYPAPVAVLMAPLGALPFRVAGALFSVILIGAVALALRLLGVRDWRCYGVAYLSMAAVTGVVIGTLSPLLLLGCAAVWRYRDRALIAGAALAAMVVAKLFVWPLAVWLLATRRFRAALAAAGFAVASLALGWAIIGFAGLREYPHLLRSIASTERNRSYSTGALAHALGMGSAAGQAFSLLVLAAALGLVVWATRFGDGTRAAFVVAIGASLVASPIVWVHYLVLLLTPIALRSPRLTALWFLPLLTWTLDNGPSDGVLWRIALALAIVVATVAAASRYSTRYATSTDGFVESSRGRSTSPMPRTTMSA